ncbi:MAG: anion permease [Candidatus Omnitrophica bacterium]|nr:anion permease [Candidatus Omnitrophota bacterium]
MAIPFLIGAVLFLAYTNGANDNFKGVATLFGSRTTDYRRALLWATVTTFAGCLAAIGFSHGLIKAFSGKGLVPSDLISDPAFLLSIGFGAALTVLLATLTGFPISTTHALTGALVGAGWMAVGSQVNFGKLGHSFFLPLAMSPLLSMAITSALYPSLRFVRNSLGVSKQLCLCVGTSREAVHLHSDGTAVLKSTGTVLTVGEMKQCVERYEGAILGIDSQKIVDALHYISAGTVGFARGLNDAPKIVALLVAAQAFQLSIRQGLFLTAAAMVAGGLLSARKVARTMSERITDMNHGQSFTANLVTSILVTTASCLALPVSTTHVSCGALFGIGTVTGKAHFSVIRNVILSWIVTLPVAVLTAALIYGFSRW